MLLRGVVATRAAPVQFTYLRPGLQSSAWIRTVRMVLACFLRRDCYGRFTPSQ
jgi:hypothetical protein